ncbi:MAG: FixH family protein [Flavipsychrobacter sp.]
MKKLNWGARIAILYGSFMALIIALVIGSMKQDSSLVADDYYQQELVYQELIDASKNQATLSSPLAIRAEEHEVYIDFPEEMVTAMKSGNVYFYSPINKLWDHKVEFNNSNPLVSVSREQLVNTRYVVKVDWEVDGKRYYQESEVTLN